MTHKLVSTIYMFLQCTPVCCNKILSKIGTFPAPVISICDIKNPLQAY